MKQTNAQRGSSRRNVITLTMSRADAVTTSSPFSTQWPTTEPPSDVASTCPRSSSVSMDAASALDRAGAADLLLQQQHAVKQRLRGRRTARHVDVDRHDAIAAAHHRI